ncbi:MAG: hypothetical protein Kow00117_13750 [Phototrophicales bacterium]|nr:MAG: hypothetical protein CUN56_01820 [Phototrophicales bacterium]RMG70123.1 MAG: hypothetical protein D6711_18245 [Chloroflexota bacterium]
MIYKVSYVVKDGDFPGGIRNETERPMVGSLVKIGPRTFEIIEIHEMMPPRDGFQFLHALVAEPSEAKSSADSYF